MKCEHIHFISNTLPKPLNEYKAVLRKKKNNELHLNIVNNGLDLIVTIINKPMKLIHVHCTHCIMYTVKCTVYSDSVKCIV